MLPRVLPILLLAACQGPDEDTLLEELRVLSLRADPPQAGPGVFRVDATVVDPLDQGAEFAMWTCLNGAGGCLEENLGDLALWSTWAPVDGEEYSHTFPSVIPPGIELPFGPAVYGLACEPGLCPLLDLLADPPEPGTQAYDEAAAWMADPFGMLEELPLEGVALTFRFLPVDDGSGATNPVVTRDGEGPVQSVPEQESVLRFRVDGASPTVAYPYADAGGWTMPAVEVIDGEVELRWIAPSYAQDPVRLYVAFESEDGGSAIWKGQAVVR